MSATVVLFLLLGVGAYLAVCLRKGFGPPPPDDEFVPEQSFVREFRNAPTPVLAAYRRAVDGTPGMSVVDATGDRAILVDLRPTMRILGGNFGLLIRFSFTGTDYGCRVTTAAMNKVPFAIFVNHAAALTHAEREVRMRAKRFGLSEELVHQGP